LGNQLEDRIFYTEWQQAFPVLLVHKLKVKKFALQQVPKVQKRSRGIALLFLT
jgi:hypothetical protein